MNEEDGEVNEMTLGELYGQWSMSRLVLEEARTLVASPQQRARVKAALENALMRLVLDEDDLAPIELFSRLDTETLRYGFECVGMDGAPELVMRLEAFVRERVCGYEGAIDAPEPSLEREALIVGEWRQVRNAPVERLLRYALERMEHREALACVAASGLRYSAIYAETRHIGPPQIVYDLFHDWGVRNEGFASPFNTRLLGKEGAGFFSAFPSTDRPFGSRGSFFSSDWKEFEGAWCVDPPFLPETLRRTDDMIAEWRGQGCPPILLIGPSSYDVQTRFDEEVRLEKGTHFYEGLDGGLHPLPVDVSIWRFGELQGFDAAAIREGYLPTKRAV